MSLDGKTFLEGKWLNSADGPTPDESCREIDHLVANVLQHVADHPGAGAWRSLFRDPRDGRLWERIYPQSELHGGGPPALRHLDKQQAKKEYGEFGAK